MTVRRDPPYPVIHWSEWLTLRLVPCGSCSQRPNRAACGKPKTAAGRRAIAMTASALDALRAHRLRQAEALLAVAVRIGPDSLVFGDRFGGPRAEYGPLRAWISVIGSEGRIRAGVR